MDLDRGISPARHAPHAHTYDARYARAPHAPHAARHITTPTLAATRHLILRRVLRCTHILTTHRYGCYLHIHVIHLDTFTTRGSRSFIYNVRCPVVILVLIAVERVASCSQRLTLLLPVTPVVQLLLRAALRYLLPRTPLQCHTNVVTTWPLLITTHYRPDAFPDGRLLVDYWTLCLVGSYVGLPTLPTTPYDPA